MVQKIQIRLSMNGSLKRLIFFLLIALGIQSCVNDIQKIKKITFKSTDPDEKTTDLVLTYTDSGQAKIRLIAPLAESFAKPNKVIKFREGIKLEFYTKKGALLSSLTAKYGEIDELNGTMFVKDSVRMFNNVKKQELQTEELFWTRKDSVIFTNKLVIIKTPKVLLYGDGIRAKQDFSSYKFIKPKGKFDLD